MAFVFALTFLLLQVYYIEGLCPDQWTQFHGSCYFLFEDKQEWSQANYLCGTHSNGHLVTIDSSAKDHFLLNLVKNTQVHHSDVWIGANDQMVEGDFMWAGTNSKLHYHHWLPHEPDNSHGDENCAVINSVSNGWNDVACNRRNEYICETSPKSDIVG